MFVPTIAEVEKPQNLNPVEKKQTRKKPTPNPAKTIKEEVLIKEVSTIQIEEEEEVPTIQLEEEVPTIQTDLNQEEPKPCLMEIVVDISHVMNIYKQIKIEDADYRYPFILLN